jgi:tetratricopeptide (TPR) repeat protein
MSESPAPAVFLSYASQDAEAAQRICEALRVAGVEVWFDRNELRGGDAWDVKIRMQIKECSLFMPVISANTNARPEGYFRLEWKLAVDRSHLLADDHPFLFPVAVGDVNDSTARVPDKFREVQWTRLRLEETPVELAGRVAKLLSLGDPSAGRTDGGVRRERAERDERRAARWRWWMIFPIVGTLIGLGFAVQPLWRAFQGPRANHPAASPRSKAQQLVAQARELYEPWNLATIDDFKFADRLLKEATDLEISNGDAWAALAIESYGQLVQGFDRSDVRDETLRNAADRAMTLAPKSDQAKLALALKYRRIPGNDDEALKILQELAARNGTDKMILQQLGRALEVKGLKEEALAVYERGANLPGGNAAAVLNRAMTLKSLGRMDEAVAEIDHAIALRPDFAMARVDKLLHLFYDKGDFEAVKAELRQLPPRVMENESMASMAAFLWYWLREPDKADEALRRVTRDYVESNIVRMPKAMLTGLIHRSAGRKDAAAVEWRVALRVIEERLAAHANSAGDIGDKAFLQALLGDRATAADTLRTYEEMMRTPVGRATRGTWIIYAELGREEAVMQFLEEELSPAKIAGSSYAALVRAEPYFDRFRDQPRFRELAARVEQRFAAKDAKK